VSLGERLFRAWVIDCLQSIWFKRLVRLGTGSPVLETVQNSLCLTVDVMNDTFFSAAVLFFSATRVHGLQL